VELERPGDHDMVQSGPVAAQAGLLALSLDVQEQFTRIRNMNIGNFNVETNSTSPDELTDLSIFA